MNLNIYKPMMINNEIFVRMVSCGRCLEIALVQVLGECRWQRFFFNLSVLLTGKLKMKLEIEKKSQSFDPPPSLLPSSQHTLHPSNPCPWHIEGQCKWSWSRWQTVRLSDLYFRKFIFLFPSDKHCFGRCMEESKPNLLGYRKI